MEWVETTGRTIEEAKGLALDRLGVADEDAEFEILEEPKAGLFGRTRGEARVRARIKPRSPRSKVDRRDRRRREGDGERRESRGENGRSPNGQRRNGSRSGERAPRKKEAPSMSDTDNGAESAPRPAADPARVAGEAEKFLVGLADAFGMAASASSSIDGEEIDVDLNGADLGLMVGPRGSTLQAIQDITRVVSQRRIGDHDTRLRVDIGSYRAKRKEALGRFVNQVADEVVASGSARALEPMPSADRKIIHDALTGRTDIATHSEGEEPFRRVIISPAPTE